MDNLIELYYNNRLVYVDESEWEDDSNKIYLKNRHGAYLRWQISRLGKKTIGTPSSSGCAVEVLKKELKND